MGAKKNKYSSLEIWRYAYKGRQGNLWRVIKNKGLLGSLSCPFRTERLQLYPAHWVDRWCNCSTKCRDCLRLLPPIVATTRHWMIPRDGSDWRLLSIFQGPLRQAYWDRRHRNHHCGFRPKRQGKKTPPSCEAELVKRIVLFAPFCWSTFCFCQPWRSTEKRTPPPKPLR